MKHSLTVLLLLTFLLPSSAQLVEQPLEPLSDLPQLEYPSTESPWSDAKALIALFALFASAGAVPGYFLARRKRKGAVVVKEASVEHVSDLTYPEAAAVVLLSIPIEDAAEVTSHMTDELFEFTRETARGLPPISEDLARSTLAFLAHELDLTYWDLADLLETQPDLVAETLTDWLEQ